jgi:hypothetical protein
VLRIFGSKRDEVMGGQGKLHNEELHDLYSLPNIIRIIKLMRIRCVGHVVQMAEKRNMYRLLVGKPEGKRPPERPRCRWIDNIKMDSSCERCNEPSGSIKCWETTEWPAPFAVVLV